jgi:hypothetical protein
MGEAASHIYSRKTASRALLKAMDELGLQADKSSEELEGITLGQAYELAVAVYGENLPDFWRIWNEWNEADDNPAPMGDL